MILASYVSENANMACIEDFACKDDNFVVEWVTKQGLQKLIDVFKGMCYIAFVSDAFEQYVIYFYVSREPTDY